MRPLFAFGSRLQSREMLPPSSTFRDDLAKLRGLAGDKGYRLEKAQISGTCFLIDETTGKPAISDRGEQWATS